MRSAVSVGCKMDGWGTRTSAPRVENYSRGGKGSAWGLLALCALVVGCKRDCGSRPELDPERPAIALTQFDCPDGLARCDGGDVETSVLARVSQPADCPWIPAGRCQAGCVAEGVVLPLPAAFATTQLCKGPRPRARRIEPAVLRGVEESDYRCDNGVVSRSDQGVLVAACDASCATAELAGETLSVETVAELLCSAPVTTP